MQSSFVVHLMHEPCVGPVSTHVGADDSSQLFASGKSATQGAHDPSALHTGAFAAGHWNGLPLPNGPSHLSQKPEVTSQTGAAPSHCAPVVGFEKQYPPGFGGASLAPAPPAVAPRSAPPGPPERPFAPGAADATHVLDFACTRTRPPAPPPPGP